MPHQRHLYRGRALLKFSSLALLASTCCIAQSVPSVQNAPASSKMVRHWTLDLSRQPVLTHEQKLQLVRQHIKHVFVLFQELYEPMVDHFLLDYP